ncbi:MAG: PorT family protein [Dysgonamonadaceae bacterium]|jgi:hypothetical protein|nr:PorT family protein [Dysgonamonadaceae bacterium]
MQKQQSYNKKDNFNEIVRRKMENYAVPVEDDSWDVIEKRLNNRSQKRRLWPWISGVSAAAAIALIIWLLFPVKENLNDYDTKNLLSGYETTVSENVFEEKILQPLRQTETPVRIRKANREPSGNLATVVHEVKAEEKTAEIAKTEENEATVSGEELIAFQNNDWEKDEPVRVKKQKRQKSIGLSIGSGGNRLAMNDNVLVRTNELLGDTYLRTDALYGANAALSELLPPEDDFSEINHRPPLSFGLTVTKELTSVLSLETGLVYSYLQSDYSNTVPKKKAKSQLHYLGIPLHLHVNILGDNHTKWAFYCSLGGMAEKGLKAVYTQIYYANNEPFETKTNKNIDDLQWSLSFAPGIDYKLHQSYSIYLEPKLSYYFDNEQPQSIRTDKPWVLGLNAGLRLNW